MITALIIAPCLAVLEGGRATEVLPQSLTYVTSNVTLHMNEYGVAGLPHGTYTPGVVNGALWTLFYEFACYLTIAALGIVGMLARRRLTAAILVVVWLARFFAMAGVDLPTPLLRRFLVMFLLGACAYLYRDVLPITGRAAAVAVAVTLLAASTMPDYRPVGGPAFAYVLLRAMVALPWRWDPGIDLSYGIYIWHWPIEVVLVICGAAAWGAVPLLLAAITLSGIVAALSWHVIERPALTLKSLRASAPAWSTSLSLRRR